MGKKPNAAQITQGLAALGGGPKSKGGGGMIAGIENVYNTGAQFGFQQAQLGTDVPPPQIGGGDVEDDTLRGEDLKLPL
jgi:hypothetical protein